MRKSTAAPGARLSEVAAERRESGRRFSRTPCARGVLSERLPYEAPDQSVAGLRVAAGADVVAVISARRPPRADVEWFRALMPLFASIFGAGAHSRRGAGQGEAGAGLALPRGHARRRRSTGCAGSSKRRSSNPGKPGGVVAANGALAAKAVELNEVNDRLQSQAEELEVQSEELQAQTDTLQETVAELRTRVRRPMRPTRRNPNSSPR